MPSSGGQAQRPPHSGLEAAAPAHRMRLIATVSVTKLRPRWLLLQLCFLLPPLRIPSTATPAPGTANFKGEG